MSTTGTTQQPLQKVSWKEKTKSNKEWFKNNIDYRIGGSVFGDSSTANARTSNIQELYDIFNSKFPERWFTHITNPLSTDKKEHKQWPAKMRPANIISPIVNFLYGEYPGRPFDFFVSEKGDDGYNSFMEAQKEHLYKNLSQIFINTINETNQGQGEQPEDPDNPSLDTGVDSKEVELPEDAMDKFVNSYKSLLSEQAQTDLDLILEEQGVREKLLDMFKDWLIAGEAFSYKDVIRDQAIYERVSPMDLDYDMSPDLKYVEDGNWAVRKMVMSINDIVDRFYDSIEDKDLAALEGTPSFHGSATNFASYLGASPDLIDADKYPVYHVVWKGLEKIYELTYFDEETGELQVDIVAETYKPNEELGEVVKSYWVTQVLEGYRIGSDLHLEMDEVTYQPNQINNLSKHKLPYNGRCFSNTHSQNTSVTKLGIPFQIMYTIVFFTLEKTIAKSRGKVVIMDKAAIPNGPGWDDEKFFYWADAQGYALVDRNQVGVDRSMQYQVLDLGLFEHITNLINLLDYCEKQYEKQIGITPQRKGEVKASETASGTNSAVAQSAIITEMIFTNFDQLVKSDLNGLLNCSQIANIEGKKALYRGSDMRNKILDINPDNYCYADFGLNMTNAAEEVAQLARIRGYAQAFAQNGASPESVIAVETANNISTLKNILKEVEEKQRKMAEQQAESEQEAQEALIQLEQEFKEYEALLDIQGMHEEYDRKHDLVIAQGDINMALDAGRAPEEGTNAQLYRDQKKQIEKELAIKEKAVDGKISSDKAKSKAEQKKLQIQSRAQTKAKKK